ncbi:MAG: ribulose phosphate epimerase [Nannocystis sp.]|nr:ribulose phosphate epimerase [Nannocystis sp.]MBA3545098.1 ribulose phosphate epimerase [Nannocystis sp.]
MRVFRSPSIILLGLWLTACSDKPSGEGSAVSATDPTGGESAENTGSPASATDPASATEAASATDPSSASQPGTSTVDPSGPATATDDTGSFLQNPDGGVSGQCDPLVQDCPVDQKCSAVSDAPGDPWGINICVPKTGDGQAGDPCDIEGGKYTGLDNCDVGLICLLTDDEGLGGACVAFCDGNSACPNSDAKCVVYNDGSLPICLDSCDPLVQDCPEGQACYSSAGDTFVCFKESVMPGEGMVGSTCNFVNQCQKGTFCAAPDAVVGCGAESGCCTPYCPVSGGAQPCQNGEECVAFFVEGSAPPGLDDVGVCAIPG